MRAEWSAVEAEAVDMEGMVAAPQVAAVEAGVHALRDGGNAVDAAVVAAFVQIVVDPQMCGLGGFGMATVRTADGGEAAVDFNASAGARVTPDMWAEHVLSEDWTGYGYHLDGAVNDIGYQSIMTPGTVAGLAELLRRFGSGALTWADALAPAIAIAEQGAVVTPELWRLWNGPASGLFISMGQRMYGNAANAALYLDTTGQTPLPGARFHNPDQLQTLRRLAESGPEDFYTGALARELAADLAANDAFVTADDLAEYRVRVTEPLRLRYRDSELATSPPAGGGVCLAQILKIIEGDDLADLGHNSSAYIALLAHAMQAGFYDWNSVCGDPAFVDVPLDELLSDAHAGQWRERIRRGERIHVPRYPETHTTTNVSVMDDVGNAIALTHSLGASSGVVTPGTGVHWNNCMNTANPIPGHANSIAPGKRRLTGMAPTIATRDGQPFLALGAPGGTRIITSVLQTLLNSLDHGMSPLEAVSAPRFDCQGDMLDCEARIPSWTRAELAARGFTLYANPAGWDPYSVTQLVTRDAGSGAFAGAADPRGGGMALST
jgi:gamma-glutamyltranspeptidase/glutathione hydrolase